MDERKTRHTYSAYYALGLSRGWSEHESEEYALVRLSEDRKFAAKHAERVARYWGDDDEPLR